MARWAGVKYTDLGFISIIYIGDLEYVWLIFISGRIEVFCRLKDSCVLFLVDLVRGLDILAGLESFKGRLVV